MENIRTKRLTIAETDAETAAKAADAETEELSMREMLEALPLDQVDKALEDTDAVLQLCKELGDALDPEQKRYFGAWDSDGKLIGCMTVSQWDSDCPELGLNIVKEYQTQGYGYEFAQAIIPVLFELTGAEKLLHRIRIDNEASEKLAKKLRGVLQPSRSKIEEMTLRRYFIYR